MRVLRRSGWVRGVRAAAGRVRRAFPLTALGMAVLAVTAAAYAGFARPRVDYVIQLVCLLALALVALAVLGVVPAAVRVLVLARRAGAAAGAFQVMEARQGFASLLRLPARVLPRVEVRWRWVEPRGFRVEAAVAGPWLEERAFATARADVETVVREWSVEDAFGLARVSFRTRQRATVRVLPWRGALHLAPLLQALSRGEDLPHPAGSPTGDRADMRRYSPGDPLRLLLWKIYARTGELMVRTPEQSISPRLRVAAYLVAADGDEPPAGAARLALESGVLGDGWLFSADGAAEPASVLDDALALVARSVGFRNRPAGEATGLSTFVAAAAARGQRQLLVFVPARPGPWLVQVAVAVRRWQGPVTCCVAADGVAGQVARAARWLRLPADAEADGLFPATADRLGEVCDTLRRAGAGVVALDRAQGRALVAAGTQRRAA
ncbi:MAG: DUF58 domain-containing protein [Deltaproteobacteria bacterium]|nr:DUF58 domain-containing protein [Deltaproteobacteria bacterium]